MGNRRNGHCSASGAGSGGPQSCLQASEGLSRGKGTELAVWPQGVKTAPTRRSRYREISRRNRWDSCSRGYEGRSTQGGVRLLAWRWGGGCQAERETPRGFKAPIREELTLAGFSRPGSQMTRGGSEVKAGVGRGRQLRIVNEPPPARQNCHPEYAQQGQSFYLFCTEQRSEGF